MPVFDIAVLLGKFMHLPVFATFQGGDKFPAVEYPFRWLALRASHGLIVRSSDGTEQASVRVWNCATQSYSRF
jgi:starch synthase